jgi:hypothetical protein
VIGYIQVLSRVQGRYKQMLPHSVVQGGARNVIQFYHLFISIQPLGRFWPEPEPSQATGMAVACCILGKFLGVVCHCFPLSLDVPTFAARYLHVPINASAPSDKRWKCGRELSSNFVEMTPFLRHLRIFYMPQICDMGQTALIHFRREAC